MVLGGLDHIHGKAIHKHCIMNCRKLDTCHDHCRNAWNSCLGVKFCADNEARHIPTRALISPQISHLPCDQLLTGFVWIIPLVNIYNGWRNRSFEILIKYLVGCKWRRLAFILLLRDRIDLPTLRMQGLSWRKSYLSGLNLFHKCWRLGIVWWPLALRFGHGGRRYSLLDSEMSPRRSL